MYEYRVFIDRVVDGDTIDVVIDLGFDIMIKERVRLEGVDTPEKRTSDKIEKIFGIIASEFVEDFFNTEHEIKLVSKEYKPQGKFGRVLGDFYVNGISLCETLVCEGYAVEYHGQSKELIEQAHLANRERLIAEGKVVI